MSKQFFLLALIAFHLFFTSYGLIKIPLKRRRHTITTEFDDGESLSGKNLTLTTSTSIYYHGNITVGSNNQAFEVLFDTGSLVAWLAAKTTRKVFFNCTASTTCMKTKVNGTIKYGYGSISGKYAIDNFQIGDLQSTDQMFIDATKMKGQNIQGIIGIGNP
jgi:cathepsin D